MKIGDNCCLWRLGRYLISSNLFETDETDEISIRIQRCSTYIYIVVLFFSMYILLFQNVFEVDSQMIEVKNLSLDSYLKLRSLYTDINCPCSQISTLYGSFVVLVPTYHPICSSEFISQTWIEILVDNMTAFRFVGDFRATASTQFQILRELCYFSQLVLNNNIEAFYDTEYISGALLTEYQWHIEIKAAIDAFLDDSLTNVAHRISFLRSFVTFNLLVSGIQTSMSLILQPETNSATVDLERNFYHLSVDGPYCACDDGGVCFLPSGFYNVDMFNNNADIMYDTLESELSYVLKNWFTGCWALQSLLISSFNDSFLTNQVELNLMARYFGWSSASMLPSVLNLTESNNINITGGTFNDLLENLFIENVVTEFNYSIYFEQCQAQSCFYSTKKNAGTLYLLTSLLSLYGGLSVVLRFLIPRLVAYLVRRFWRRTEVPYNIGEFN